MITKGKTLQDASLPRADADTAQTSPHSESAYKRSRRARLDWQTTGINIGALAVLVLTGLVISGNNYLIHLATAALIAYILTASFNVIYGYTGVFNMAHVMTYGMGAFTSVYLEVRFEMNFWAAGLIAVLVATALSVIMAFPTKKLSEIFLAIQTLAFAMALSEILVNWETFSGGTTGIYMIPSPTLLGVDLVGGFAEYYWLVATFAWLVFMLVFAMHRSAMRRKMTAVRESPRILSSVGISTGSTRLIAFGISGMLAGLAGVLFAHFQLVIDLDTFSFERLIALLLAIIIGGAGYFWGPLFGVVAVMMMDELSLATSSAQDLIYGIGILLLVILTRGGIAGALSGLWNKIRPNSSGQSESSGTPANQKEAPEEPKSRVTKEDNLTTTRPDRVFTSPEDTGTSPIGEDDQVTSSSPDSHVMFPERGHRELVLSEIRVQFGGNVAVDNASIQASTGEVVGLVGPNGAGKTTLLNTVTGDVPTMAGSIELDGIELLGQEQLQVVRMGVARTFQSPKIIPELTILENVMLGGDGLANASSVEQVIYSPRARTDDRKIRARALQLLADFSLESRAGQLAGTQPYGVLRQVEIARNLMLEPSFLLLDEPGAGLMEFERNEIARIVRMLADRGIGVLLVDHNMPLVTTACDRIYVLQTGRIIAEGPPTQVFAQENVISAYLGAPL